MSFSNFLNLDKSTILDFKNDGTYQDIFINFNDEKLSLCKKGKVFIENNQYNFKLTDDSN